MESRFQSFEFKAYSSKLPEPSPPSCSSLLKKRTFDTFTEDDEFEDFVKSVEEECSDGSPQSAVDSRGEFLLSDKSFSSFHQAFEWCKRNRYKYSRHSRTFADQVLEVDKYKTYFYVCNCHGSICRNERKLEFRSTDLDSYEILIYERGVHSSMSSVPKARGIDNRFVDYIDQHCRDNKNPKQILESLKCKVCNGDYGPLDVLAIPSADQIKNRKMFATKEGEQYQQYNRAYRVQEWTANHLITSQEGLKHLPMMPFSP